jgi:hypothetical protein
MAKESVNAAGVNGHDDRIRTALRMVAVTCADVAGEFMTSDNGGGNHECLLEQLAIILIIKYKRRREKKRRTEK